MSARLSRIASTWTQWHKERAQRSALGAVMHSAHACTKIHRTSHSLLSTRHCPSCISQPFLSHVEPLRRRSRRRLPPETDPALPPAASTPRSRSTGHQPQPNLNTVSKHERNPNGGWGWGRGGLDVGDGGGPACTMPSSSGKLTWATRLRAPPTCQHQPVSPCYLASNNARSRRSEVEATPRGPPSRCQRLLAAYIGYG